MKHGKKIILSIGIFLLLAGSIGVIGWIGFQEHFRLLARSFQKESTRFQLQSQQDAADQKFEDHSVIETKREAQVFVNDLLGRSTGLENDDLPEQ